MRSMCAFIVSVSMMMSCGGGRANIHMWGAPAPISRPFQRMLLENKQYVNRIVLVCLKCRRDGGLSPIDVFIYIGCLGACTCPAPSDSQQMPCSYALLICLMLSVLSMPSCRRVEKNCLFRKEAKGSKVRISSSSDRLNFFDSSSAA